MRSSLGCENRGRLGSEVAEGSTTVGRIANRPSAIAGRGATLDGRKDHSLVPLRTKPMRCTKCGTESTTSGKFCPECGSPLSNRCPKCATDNKPTSKFCEECGTGLGASTESVAPSSSQARSTALDIRVTREQSATDSMEGERKTVTALFADIKGSTELMEDLDPEEARAIIDPALRLMIDAVHRYDGYVVQSTGDGIFALLGAPVAHEDHPQRALYAALRMQEELKRYSARLREAGTCRSKGAWA